MSTWSDGSKVEKLYENKLISNGWITRRWPKSRFGKQDLWGCDIVAKRFGKTLYIQVKSNGERIPPFLTKTVDALKELWKHCGDDDKILWVGYNRKTKEWKEIEIKDPYDK